MLLSGGSLEDVPWPQAIIWTHPMRSPPAYVPDKKLRMYAGGLLFFHAISEADGVLKLRSLQDTAAQSAHQVAFNSKVHRRASPGVQVPDPNLAHPAVAAGGFLDLRQARLVCRHQADRDNDALVAD